MKISKKEARQKYSNGCDILIGYKKKVKNDIDSAFWSINKFYRTLYCYEKKLEYSSRAFNEVVRYFTECYLPHTRLIFETGIIKRLIL